MFDNVERIFYEDELAVGPPPPARAPRRDYVREDPFVTMGDREFRLHYRFTKESVLVLTDLLDLQRDEWDNYLTPLQMVLLTLSSLGAD